MAGRQDPALPFGYIVENQLNPLAIGTFMWTDHIPWLPEPRNDVLYDSRIPPKDNYYGVKKLALITSMHF